MLLSHRKRFIYLKTVRTASTSTELFLEPWCLPEGTEPRETFAALCTSAAGIAGDRSGRGQHAGWWDHMSAATVRDKVSEEFGRDVWNGYRKIANIRNPFDKAVSQFCYWEKRWGKPTPEPLRIRFKRWLLSNQPRGQLSIDSKIYGIDGTPCVDAFIRYESLRDDLAAVCRLLDIPADTRGLQRLQGGYRPAVDLTEFYDDENEAVVAAHYSYEFSAFGYPRHLTGNRNNG